MDFAGSINYMLECIKKIPTILTGLTYYTGGGIQKTISRLSDKNTHINMTNQEYVVYDGMMVNFYCSIACTILNLIVTIIAGGLGGILVAGFGVVGSAIGIIVGLVIYTVLITFGRANNTHWNMGLIKFIQVITLIWMVVTGVSAIAKVVGIIPLLLKLNVLSLLLQVVGVISALATLLGIGMIMNGLNDGEPFANQPQFDNTPNPNFNNQSNQGFGQQNSPSAGFGDFNQGFGQQQQEFQTHQVEQGFGSQQQGFGSQQQQGFGRSQGFGQQQGFGNQQNNFNRQQNQQHQQPQQPQQQMYQCPYCGQPIAFGVKSCPHCNNLINWG